MRTQSLSDTLFSHAEQQPNVIAVNFSGDTLTWEELALTMTITVEWIRQNIQPNHSIALELPTSQSSIILFLSAIHAGMEVQIINPEWPSAISSEIISSLSPGILFTQQRTSDVQGTHCLPDPFLPFSYWKTYFKTQSNTIKPTRSVNIQRIFYTGFTSGSSGIPKGFKRTEKSWLDSFYCEQNYISIKPRNVIFVPGSIHHSLTTYALLRGLCFGATVLLQRSYRPTYFVRTIEEQTLDAIYGVPTHFSSLIHHLEQTTEQRQHNIRYMINSGGKLPEDIHQQLTYYFPDTEIIELYGASELSLVSLSSSSISMPLNSVGRPCCGVDVMIRNSTGDIIDNHVTGTIFVKSPYLFSRYVDEEKHKIVHQDGYMSIGDRGYLDSDGYLYLTGRNERVANIAGKKVFVEEIESILGSLPEIDQSAAFSIPDRQRGERLVMILQFKQNKLLNRHEIISRLTLRLPSESIPRKIGVIDSWPLNASGKTDLPRIKMLWESGRITPLK